MNGLDAREREIDVVRSHFKVADDEVKILVYGVVGGDVAGGGDDARMLVMPRVPMRLQKRLF